MSGRRYISILREDELRLEFDILSSIGKTSARTFENWMRHARHAEFDASRGRWYVNRR